MRINTRMIGAGVAAAVAAGFGYAMLRDREETLGFDTVVRDGAFSVRRYPQLLVAETLEPGPRDSALTRGVLALADFLDRARGSLGLPRIAPLLADGADDRGWRTRIVLPADAEVEALGAGDDDGVVVRLLEPRRLAAIRFAGETDDRALERHEDELRSWMEAQGLQAAGPAGYAFYHSPLTPAPFKRSDVLIPLAA